MDERRQLPRWEIKKQVKVLIASLEGVRHCMIEDMHLKGMCLSLDRQLPTEQPLKIAFAISRNADFVNIEAHVPWARQDNGRYYYGLSFSKIADYDKDMIYQFVHSNCSEQFNDKWWA